MSETPALVVDVSLARSMVEPLYRDLTLPTGENVMQPVSYTHLGGPQGLRVRVTDMDLAPSVARSLARTLPPGAYASDWSRQNRTWFAAVQVEKRMMGIILFLIVLVGAFGLVSSLVMTVKEKQADIAILRTLGALSLIHI